LLELHGSHPVQQFPLAFALGLHFIFMDAECFPRGKNMVISLIESYGFSGAVMCSKRPEADDVGT
jgi:hypothetical protein